MILLRAVVRPRLVRVRRSCVCYASTSTSSATYANSSRDHNPFDLHQHEVRFGQDEPPWRNKNADGLSDSEWDIRTGAAIDTLTHTLPNFFQTGLVSNIPDTPPPPGPTGFTASCDQIPLGERPIFSPKIRLSYSPPAALPSPFPRTLHIDGTSLFFLVLDG
jgi:hypothetical protein